jgi:hypothetical protein
VLFGARQTQKQVNQVPRKQRMEGDLYCINIMIVWAWSNEEVYDTAFVGFC